MGLPDPDRPAPQLSPEARQRALRGLLCKLLHTNRRDAAVNVVEDLHWMDEGSDALLGELLESVAGTKTLVVLNYRPEYSPSWGELSNYRHIPLEPLGPADTEKLLRDLVGEDPSLDGLAELIHERTAGNPFFIEEIVRELSESGALEGERGAQRLVRPVCDVKVPASVQTVLAARIDRLDPDAKRLLQAMSVAGKEVAQPALMQVSGFDDEESCGEALKRADRRRVPLRGRALSGAGDRLPPSAHPRGRLRDPARRAAGADPRGGGARRRSTSTPSATMSSPA